MNIFNDMNCIHYNKENNIDECNFLYGMLNYCKLTKM